MSDETLLYSNKRGYLTKNFELFHLKDKLNQEFELHYHDFNKIIIFLSGEVSYLIEGKSYKLKPWDILLVNNYEVHKPLINSNELYERIVIWVNSNFLANISRDFDLLQCFNIASTHKINLLRPNNNWVNNFEKLIAHIETTLKSKESGNDLLSTTYFLQFMVYLNRLFINYDASYDSLDIKFDKNIEKVLDYINSNLCKDLSLNTISSKFFMSKYYLMHKFKNETGYTIHSYINQKRLILAADLLKKNTSISSVCTQCGFNDYSTFVRAFKKMYNISPKAYVKNHIS